MDHARENGVGTVMLFSILGLGLAGGLGYYLYRQSKANSRNFAYSSRAASSSPSTFMFTKKQAAALAREGAKWGNSPFSNDISDYVAGEPVEVPAGTAGCISYQVPVTVKGTARIVVDLTRCASGEESTSVPTIRPTNSTQAQTNPRLLTIRRGVTWPRA
jgi:hypothetical protein